jgi:NADPH:quinone reductase-like Zn-dependent oxidoreductase
VRVRIEGAGVNPSDVSMVQGAYKDFMPTTFPLIPGNDLAGVVDAVGPGADGLAVGARVFGQQGKRLVGEGTFAEYTLASIGTIAERPDALDTQFAAAIPLVGVSALQSVEAAAPGPGDVVVVIGASGGIGSIAPQLLREAGAVPIAVTRQVNHDYVRELGAAETIDYETQDVANDVRAAHPDGIAAVIDLARDRELTARMVDLLGDGGRLASMVGSADADALQSRGIVGTNIQTRVTTQRLDQLAGLVAEGKLRRPDIATFGLPDAGRALSEIAAHHVRGKLVVLPS